MEFKIIASNKKAFRDYHLFDKWECGILLTGPEVKSLRNAQASFTDSFARVDAGEMKLFNLYISPYMQASYQNLEPTRIRTLLLHKKEIVKIADTIAQKKLALIPTRIYFNKRGLVKVEIALGKGKKIFDKREDVKKRDVDRELKQRMHSRRK